MGLLNKKNINDIKQEKSTVIIYPWRGIDGIFLANEFGEDFSKHACSLDGERFYILTKKEYMDIKNRLFSSVIILYTDKYDVKTMKNAIEHSSTCDKVIYSKMLKKLN